MSAAASSSKVKWTKEKIDDFFFQTIAPQIEEGYFPKVSFLLENNYVAFYVSLLKWKTHSYKSIEDFCIKNNLKRESSRETKWTKEFVDTFYEENILPHVEDNYLPFTSWFLEKGGDYWAFIGVINAWKIEGYKNMKDFKKKKKLKLNRRTKNFSKDDIDEFYVSHIQKELIEGALPTKNWFEKKGWTYRLWIRSIISGKNGYENITDFTQKHNIKTSRSLTWNREKIDEMYQEYVRPLMKWNKLLSYSRIKFLGWKYLEWYNQIRNKRVEGYDSIKDFKKKNKLD